MGKLIAVSRNRFANHKELKEFNKKKKRLGL